MSRATASTATAWRANFRSGSAREEDVAVGGPARIQRESSGRGHAGEARRALKRESVGDSGYSVHGVGGRANVRSGAARVEGVAVGGPAKIQGGSTATAGNVNAGDGRKRKRGRRPSGAFTTDTAAVMLQNGEEGGGPAGWRGRRQ